MIDEKDVTKVIQVIEPIYQSNITNETDAAKKKVASQAIVNVLKKDKENFSQAAFHAEFKKLYGKEEDTVPMQAAINFPDAVFFEKPLGDNGKLSGKISFSVNGKNAPLLSGKAEIIPDTELNGSVFKNSIDPISKKLSSTLLNGGVTAKGIEGYDWLTLSISASAGGYSKNLLDSEDFSLTAFSISGTVKGTIPPEKIREGLLSIPYYQKLPSFAQLDIDKWIKISVSASFSYSLTISKNDRKLLEKMRKLGNKFIEEVEALEPLEKDFEADTKKSAKAKNNLKKAKGTKDKKLIKQAERQLNKASNQLKQSRRKLKNQENKLKKIGSKIDDAAAKLSKGAKPLGKLLKKQIAKRAFSIASKFIPGLNIITTAMDIYDVAVIFGPIIIEGAKSLYEELTREKEENEVPTYSGGEEKYVEGSAKINEDAGVVTVNMEFSAVLGSGETSILVKEVVFVIERKETEVYYLSSRETVYFGDNNAAHFIIEKGYKVRYSDKDQKELWEKY